MISLCVIVAYVALPIGLWSDI